MSFDGDKLEVAFIQQLISELSLRGRFRPS